MKTMTIILLGVFFFLFAPASAQTTEIVVKRGMGREVRAKIQLSDVQGNFNPSAKRFANDTRLHFRFTPQKGNLMLKFARRDLDSLQLYLGLAQQNEFLWLVDVKPTFKNPLNSTGFAGAVISFEKAGFTLREPFKFIYKDQQSTEMTLPQVYWPGYDHFLRRYQLGIRSSKDKPLAAIGLLACFHPDTLHAMGFDYSEDARNLLFKSIHTVIDTFEVVSRLVETGQMSARYAFDELNAIAAAGKAWHEAGVVLDPVLQGVASEAVEYDLVRRKRALDTTFSTLEQRYGSKVLSDYTYDEYKFELFTSLLSKMVLYKPGFSQVSRLTRLPIELVEHFPEEKRELTRYHFLSEFKRLVQLINQNITMHQYLMDESLMLHLKGLQTVEPYPNYEIMQAANRLAAGDLVGFSRELQAVLDVAGTSDRIELAERWVGAVEFTMNQTDPGLLENLSKGITMLEAQNIAAASNAFDMAFRLDQRSWVALYYLGLTHYLQGQKYTGLKFFRKALAENPRAMMPYVKELAFYREEKAFEQALSIADSALAHRPNNWFMLTERADLLYRCGRLEEAKKVILDKVLPVRSRMIEQYFLMGDIYLAQDSLKMAETYYNKAGDIDPTHSFYEKRMRSLFEQKRK